MAAGSPYPGPRSRYAPAARIFAVPDDFEPPPPAPSTTMATLWGPSSTARGQPLRPGTSSCLASRRTSAPASLWPTSTSQRAPRRLPEVPSSQRRSPLRSMARRRPASTRSCLPDRSRTTRTSPTRSSPATPHAPTAPATAPRRRRDHRLAQAHAGGARGDAHGPGQAARPRPGCRLRLVAPMLRPRPG